MKKITLLCLLCMMSLSLGLQSKNVQPANTIKLAITKQDDNHPRLLFNVDDVSALQANSATTHQDIWIPIRDYVESELGTSPPSSAPSDGDENTYRIYGNMMIPLAFACVISEDTDYCNLAKTYLLTYASWDQWGDNNWRDLGHAHMLLGNAIAYDWLYDTLTSAERQTVRDSLANWTQKMYEASSGFSYREDWHNWWRDSYVQNHHWSNNSALGIAGLVLLDEDDRAQMWIDQASSQISRASYILNEIEDGSWHEGTHYQSYGLTMALPFMINLKRIQNNDIIPYAYLRNYPYWRIYNHIPNSVQFILSFGDFDWNWGNAYQPQNLLRFAASEYDNGYAEWLAQQLIAADGRQVGIWAAPWYVFEFFYYNPDVNAQSPASLPKTRIFSDLEGVIWRTGWNEDDLIFGLKTGAYGGRFVFDALTQEHYPWEPPCLDLDTCRINAGHDHDDTNAFYIYKAGQWLAPENVGWINTEATLHNTLLIDGQGQSRFAYDVVTSEELTGNDGFLEATASTLNFDYAIADATRRYKEIAGLEDITRHVLFVRPDYFIMLDNLTANAPHQYTWVSHFGESVSVEGNWVRGNAGGGQILGVNVVAPSSFETTTGDDGQPYVHIQPTSPLTDVQLVHLLYPTDNAAWNAKPAITLVEDASKSVALQVAMTNSQPRTDDILLTYVKSTSVTGTGSLIKPTPVTGTGSFVGPTLKTKIGDYRYDGRTAVVSKDPNGVLKKLFVYDATFLEDQAAGIVLVQNLHKGNPFEAVYSGQVVSISGPILSAVTLYAPGVTSVMVNDVPWEYSRSGDYITLKVRFVYLPIILKE